MGRSGALLKGFWNYPFLNVAKKGAANPPLAVPMYLDN